MQDKLTNLRARHKALSFLKVLLIYHARKVAKKMHILIIGFGSIGKRHLRVMRDLLPNALITVVRQHGPVDLNNPPEGANAVTNSLITALSQKPNIAILAGPAAGRMDVALPLAQAGIHMLVEKPIATSTDHVEEVLKTALQNNAVFMVGYVLRQMPVLLAVKNALDNEEIGEIYSLAAHVGQNLEDWRPGTDYRQSVSAKAAMGGGAIFELSHELDYVRWLLGSPTAVTCRAGQFGNLEIDTEDTADIILEFATRVQASIHLNLLERPASRTCTVRGTKGRLDADLIAGTMRIIDAETGQSREIDVPLIKSRDDIFTWQAQHFLACINGVTPPMVSGQDGLAVLNIALAAKRSSVSGITVTLADLGSTK